MGSSRRCRAGEALFNVGSMDDEGLVYDGLVAVVWDWSWEIPGDEDVLYEDNNDRVLVYDLVILGSTRVFDCAEWDILYHHLS